MIELLGNILSSKTGRKDPSLANGPHVVTASREPERTQQEFIRPFRWQARKGAAEPDSVELVGSFTDWKKVPMAYDKATKTWHITMKNVVSNRTHHYVILVDGKPTYDHTCDGLSAPHGSHEERWQLETEKGPRVMMLFGQAK